MTKNKNLEKTRLPDAGYGPVMSMGVANRLKYDILTQCWFNVGSMMVNYGVDVSYLLRLSAQCNQIFIILSAIEFHLSSSPRNRGGGTGKMGLGARCDMAAL